jgi:SRSO17 transposase
VNKKGNTETTRGLSLEDIGAGVAVVDTQIRVLLGQVMAQDRSAEVAFDYLGGLSGPAKATCWALAEAAGHANWSRMQALLGRYVWDYTVMRAKLAPLAARWLRCPQEDLIGAGLAIDETAALKKGDHTFAVSPQHAGCTGKVENCVTTVFTSYVTTAGSCWVDFDVYFPQRWADNPVRRARAGVPEDLDLVTKPDLAAAQIARLVTTGVPIGWVAGDEVYGRSTRLRGECEQQNLAYVFAVPSDHHLTTGPHTSTTTAAVAAKTAVYERRSCGNGSKGPRYFDWAMIATDSPRHILLIRRLISRPDQLAYFTCYVPDPAKATITYLITIAGRRWPVEETFKTAKDVLGWDQSQARTHTAVNRHTALAALAQLPHACALVATTATPAPTAPAQENLVSHENHSVATDFVPNFLIPTGDSPVPATADQPRPPRIGYIKLSIAEHRRLHELARAKAAGLLTTTAEAFHLHWSRLRRHHQAISRWHHYQHRIHLATTTP